MTAPPTVDPLRTALEPRRLEILQLIWDHEASVSTIAEALPVSIGAVSQHLSRLKEAGLVTVRAEGRYRYYRASRADMGTLAVVLESFWSDRLDALASMARSMDQHAAVTDAPTPAGSRTDTDSSTDKAADTARPPNPQPHGDPNE